MNMLMKIARTCCCVSLLAGVIAFAATREPWKSAPLFEAIKEGRTDIIKAALDAGADPNSVSLSPFYGSLLELAAAEGRLDIVNLLLAGGADPRAKGNETLLLRAMDPKNIQILKRLVEAGAWIKKPKDATDWDGLVAQAVFRGNSEAVAYLLEHGADPNDVRLSDNSTALELAAAQGNVQVLRMLLDAGADINHRDWHGVSALMEACCYGNEAAAELLASRGADSSFVSGGDQTAEGCAKQYRGEEGKRLRIACAKKQSLAAPIVGEEPWKDENLFGAVSVGRNSVLEAALAAGKDPNTTNPFYGSLLNWAAHNGRLDTVILLLTHGADPKAKGNDRLLLEPIKSGRMDILKCLVEAGARLTKPKDIFFWQDYLAIAARLGNREFVEYLLEHGENPNSATEPGDATALQLAAAYGHADIVEVLLKAGANVNLRGSDGWSPLMCACYQGNVEVAKLLLAHGADPSFKDGYDRTAADLAEHSKSGNTEELRTICAGKSGS